MSSDRTLYVVSGFMRTGTSMMMRALEAGGLEAAYQQSRDEMKDRHADAHYDPNVGGLYELERQEYLRVDFPKGYEGRLIKALTQSVPNMDIMPEGIRVAFMRRDAEEIRQSYLAFFGRELPILHHESQFQARMDLIVRQIRNRKDVLSARQFWYRDVVARPRPHFESLSEAGWPINVDRAVAVIDPSLCRYRREELVEGIV